MIRWLAVAVFFAGAGSLGCRAQDLSQLDQPRARDRQFVLYAAEQQQVTAGKRTIVELHFRVADGFHINSHTPKSELLIPTRIELGIDGGVTLGPAVYPAGQSFSFSFSPDEKLDVYAGPFTVLLPVTAAMGPHELHGTLNYQACDRAACYPPRTLPISVVVTGR